MSDAITYERMTDLRDGDVLRRMHLTHMEDGIIDAITLVNSMAGSVGDFDTITTEDIDEILEDGGE